MVKILSYLKGLRIKSSAKDKDITKRNRGLIFKLKPTLKHSLENMIDTKQIKLRKRDGQQMHLQLDITTPRILNI